MAKSARHTNSADFAFRALLRRVGIFPCSVCFIRGFVSRRSLAAVALPPWPFLECKSTPAICYIHLLFEGAVACPPICRTERCLTRCTDDFRPRPAICHASLPLCICSLQSCRCAHLHQRKHCKSLEDASRCPPAATGRGGDEMTSPSTSFRRSALACWILFA